MEEDLPTELNNAAPTSGGTWTTWIADVLLAVQLVWIFPWAIFQRGVFKGGLAKEPLFDFFVEIGAALPSIGALCFVVLHSWTARRRKSPIQNALPSIVAVILAAAIILLFAFSWFMDDVVNRNATR